MNDPLARWRSPNKDPLALDDAAALLCDLEPGLTYDRKIPEQREKFDRRAKMLRDLIAAATADPPGLAAVVVRVRAVERARAPGFSDGFGGFTIQPSPRRPRMKPQGVDGAQSTVTRAALRDWCESQGMRPSFLFPDAAKPLPSADSPMNPKAEASVLAIVAALAKLADIPLTRPHSVAPGNPADEIAVVIEGLGLRQVQRRTIAHWLMKARDLPREG